MCVLDPHDYGGIFRGYFQVKCEGELFCLSFGGGGGRGDCEGSCPGIVT